MEVLGAAASVAGLVSLAVEIPKLIDTAISIRSAPEEAKQLSQTTDALVMTLRKLEAFLKTDEASDMGLANDSALIVSISACQRRFLDVSKKLRVQSPTSSTLKNTVARFRWPFDKKECLAIIQELHAMQSTFEFCLVLSNCKQMAKSHKEVIKHFQTQGDTLKQMALSFPDQAAHTSSMIEKIQLLESCVRQAAANIDQVQIGVSELQEMQKDLAAYHADKLYGQALEWLSPIDSSARHDEISATRLAGTCDWILADKQFRTWLLVPPSKDYNGISCWVGDPGQGKTFTMSRVVDYLRDETSRAPNTDSGSYVTYLYCDYQRTRSSTTTSLIGALVRQLLTHFAQLPPQVAEIVHSACVKFRRSSARPDEMSAILEVLKPGIKRLLVCVDALDECNDSDHLLAACRDLPIKMSIFFIGRRSIERAVQRVFPKTLKAQVIDAQIGDINAVIRHRIQEDRLRQPELMPEALGEEICKAIADLANGMFLLASLHTTLVLSYDTIYRRRKALKNLSGSLEGVFGQTLARIREHKHSDQAFKMLAWLHVAGSSSLVHIRHILAVEAQHTQLHADNIPNGLSLLDYCLGLVSFDRATSRNPHLSDSTQVTLVHSTLSVYLDTNVNILADSIVALVDTCFSYLSFDPKNQMGSLFSRINASWVRLLYTLKHMDPPPRLLQTAWTRSLNFEEFLSWANNNDETNLGDFIRRVYDGKTKTSNLQISGSFSRKPPIMPLQALKMWPKGNKAHGTRERLRGQNMFHIICMLALDGLDPILSRLSRYAEKLGKQASGHINCLDSFGISPLGWVFIPESLSNGVKWLGFFENSLWRLERLIQEFPFIDPEQPLWDKDALRDMKKTGLVGNIDYFSESLYLLLLGNYTACPDAVHRCILALQTHTGFDLWSTLRNWRPSRSTTGTSTSTSTSTSAAETRTDRLWTVVALLNPERTKSSTRLSHVTREYMLNSGSLPTYSYMYPTSSHDLDDDSTPSPTINSEMEWLPGMPPRTKTRSAALFEPGKEAPVLVIDKWQQDHVDAYSRKSLDTDTLFKEIFSRVPCGITSMPRASLLHVAAAADSVEMMEFLARNYGLSLSTTDDHGRTPLHVALQWLSTSATTHLLWQADTANLSIQDSQGMSALHICAQSQQSRFADMILNAHPALIDVQDHQGKTAMHYAAERGMRQMAILLAQNKSEPNIRDLDGNSPLHLAILNRDAIICDILLDPQPGADKFSVENLQDAWKLAVEAGAGFLMTILRVLATKPQLLLATSSTSSTQPSDALDRLTGIKTLQLVSVAHSNSFAERDLEFLMNLPNSNSNSAGPSSSTSTAVIPRGAETSHVHLPDPAGTIRSALARGAENIAVYLLRQFHSEIDLSNLGEGGESVLHLAVIYDAPNVARWLLDLVVLQAEPEDDNFKSPATDRILSRLDAEGYTPLHRAIQHKRLSILELLLNARDAGLDAGICQVRPASGATALTMAITHRFAEAVPLLLLYGHVQGQSEDTSSTRLDLNHLDATGRAAIHYAVLQQDLAAVRQLLACPPDRLDPATPSRDGRTALAYAALCCGKGMVELLLGTGRFDLGLRDNYGKTALDWARQNSDREVAGLLRDSESGGMEVD